MNAYQALDIEPRLTLTLEEIDAAWRKAGKSHHPDAGGDEQSFAAAREAKTTLTNPSSRLAHWLELHNHPVDPRGTIDADTMDLFAPVGEVMQRTSALARRRAAATTALGLAMLESETLHTREEVENVITTLDAAIAAQCAPFPTWEAAPADIHTTTAATAVRNLRFLEKWKRDLMAAYASLA